MTVEESTAIYTIVLTCVVTLFYSFHNYGIVYIIFQPLSNLTTKVTKIEPKNYRYVHEIPNGTKIFVNGKERT